MSSIQTHDHVHDHAHQHDHGHAHVHAPARTAVPAYVPGFSLLRLSALERLAGAGALAALVWAGVFWALH